MVHMWGLTLAEGLGYMIYIILGYKSATIRMNIRGKTWWVVLLVWTIIYLGYLVDSMAVSVWYPEAVAVLWHSYTVI